jgi:hypothetical protein
VPRPAQYPITSLDEALKSVADMPFSQEGFVVSDSQFRRVKIKSPAYVACHRLKGECVSPRRAWDLVRIQEHTEFLVYFPEYLDIISEAVILYHNIVSYLGNLEEMLLKNQQIQIGEDCWSTNLSRRDFALGIKDWHFQYYFFASLDGEVKGIKEFLETVEYSKIPALFLS